jgi:hypothetical protein
MHNYAPTSPHKIDLELRGRKDDLHVIPHIKTNSFTSPLARIEDEGTWF